MTDQPPLPHSGGLYDAQGWPIGAAPPWRGSPLDPGSPYKAWVCVTPPGKPWDGAPARIWLAPLEPGAPMPPEVTAELVAVLEAGHCVTMHGPDKPHLIALGRGVLAWVGGGHG